MDRTTAMSDYPKRGGLDKLSQPPAAIWGIVRFCSADAWEVVAVQEVSLYFAYKRLVLVNMVLVRASSLRIPLLQPRFLAYRDMSSLSSSKFKVEHEIAAKGFASGTNDHVSKSYISSLLGRMFTILDSHLTV
jgi:hypothetical protein